MNMTNNNSSSTSFSTNSYRIAFTVAFSLQFFFSMIGNSLIVWIVYKDKRLKTTTNYLIANMAASDLLSAITLFPRRIVKINYNRWLIEGLIGSALCKFRKFTVEMSFTVSVYSCVLIAIDRYYAVAHPMKRPFQPKIKYLIALGWILSILLKSPHLYYYNTWSVGPHTVCSIPEELDSSYEYYYYIFVTLAIAAPAPVLTIIYTLILWKMYKHKVPGRQTNSVIRRREQQNLKVLKMSITIVLLLYVSFGFRFAFVFVRGTGKLSHLSKLEIANLNHVSIFMLCMSVVYNFFIYLIFNNVYRENVKAIVAKCLSGCRCKFSSSNNNTNPRVSAMEMIEIHDNISNNESCTSKRM